jgi:hypothetical protein
MPHSIQQHCTKIIWNGGARHAHDMLLAKKHRPLCRPNIWRSNCSP